MLRLFVLIGMCIFLFSTLPNTLFAASSYPYKRPNKCVSVHVVDNSKDKNYGNFYFWYRGNDLFVEIVPLNEVFIVDRHHYAVQDGKQMRFSFYNSYGNFMSTKLYVPFVARVGFNIRKGFNYSKLLTLIYSPHVNREDHTIRIDIPGNREAWPACTDPASAGDQGSGGGGCFIESIK